MEISLTFKGSLYCCMDLLKKEDILRNLNVFLTTSIVSSGCQCDLPSSIRVDTTRASSPQHPFPSAQGTHDEGPMHLHVQSQGCALFPAKLWPLCTLACAPES